MEKGLEEQIQLGYILKKNLVQIRGYGRNDLAVMFAKLGFTEGVEIGTEKGKYAEVLCKANPNLHLFCIDPWLKYDDNKGYKDFTQEMHNKNHEEAQARLKPYKATLVKAFSHIAVDAFKDETLDFVYIDGNHRLENVVQDLTDWTPKVKKGGIISGHDYIKLKKQHYMHIPYALEAYLESYGGYPLFILDQKNKVRKDDSRYDRIRSWFFVKV